MYIRPTIHTPNIQRTQVKLYITSLILQHLYGKSEQMFRDILKGIHEEQQALVKVPFTLFMFRGKKHAWKILWDINDPPELHLSLHERMQKYVNDHAQVFDFERPCVEGVLKAMFTHTEFLDDYYELLPESLHKCFEGYTEMFDSIGNKRLFGPQMDEFKERNERYLQLIRNRMMMNILL